MPHVAGATGSVLVADQLIDDCEDAWSVAGVGTATSAAVDATDKKVGDNSVKLVCGVGVNNTDVLATEDYAAVDITDYSYIIAWLKSSWTSALGDYHIGVSETADMQGAPTWVDLPVLTADTWRLCCVAITLTGFNLAISVGLQLQDNDPGAFNIWVDDVRVAMPVAGIRKWEIEYTQEVKETTDFADAGVASFMATVSKWSGSFEGFKSDAQLPLTVGDELYLVFNETSTAGNMWLGRAIITSIKPVSASDDIVTYAYTFQGTGDLEVPTT